MHPPTLYPMVASAQACLNNESVDLSALLSHDFRQRGGVIAAAHRTLDRLLSKAASFLKISINAASCSEAPIPSCIIALLTHSWMKED